MIFCQATANELIEVVDVGQVGEVLQKRLDEGLDQWVFLVLFRPALREGSEAVHFKERILGRLQGFFRKSQHAQLFRVGHS